MADEHTRRRLAAILAVDVVGYSRLMATDEAGTLAALKAHRKGVLEPAIAERGGRIVKLMGDGALVEFSSVVDAVACALAIQTADRAADGTGALTLRIGVNLGDVIIDGDDIYGDGVNVAARLEALAEPGGICISSIVHESLGGRVEAGFADGGKVQVKNIDRPIGVWRWQAGGSAPASAAPPAAQARASIAVLPFDNMSGDPEQEYFSDGISEDIITDLSKIGGLVVIARNSSFVYKGRSVDIREVAKDLGVGTVLEGSIRRAGNRVRINAQLIEAATGGHLWAERYDRELTDIFAVQDDVTRHIVEALKVELTRGEEARVAAAPTTDHEAHDLFLRGRELFRGGVWDRAILERARGYFQQAIDHDPAYADAHAGLAMSYNIDFQNRLTGDPTALDTAWRVAEQAIAKGPDEPFPHWVAATIAIWRKDLARARQETGQALALSPSFALAHATRGHAEVYAGTPLVAIPYLEQAIRLDPAFTQQYLHFMGSAYLAAGRYEAAAANFRERIRLAPKTDISRGLLIAALGHLGLVEEARQVRDELRLVNPDYSFAAHLARLPFSDAADAARIEEGYARAGVAG